MNTLQNSTCFRLPLLGNVAIETYDGPAIGGDGGAWFDHWREGTDKFFRFGNTFVFMDFNRAPAPAVKETGT